MLIPLVSRRDIVVAAGLHKDVKDRYFRGMPRLLNTVL